MSPGRIAAIGMIAALTGFVAFGIARDLANDELTEPLVRVSWIIIGGLLAYKVYANRPSIEPYADEKRTVSTKRAVSLALLLMLASAWAGSAIVDIIDHSTLDMLPLALAAALVGIAAIVYARRPVHWFHEERRPSPGQGWVVRGLHPRDASALINLENPPGRRMR